MMDANGIDKAVILSTISPAFRFVNEKLISKEAYEKITWKNAVKFFNLDI